MKFSILCFVSSVVCFIVGGGELLLGYRIPELSMLIGKFEHWLLGGEIPTFCVESHIFAVRFGNSLWGFTTSDYGSPFLCYLSAFLFAVGILSLLGTLLSSSSES